MINGIDLAEEMIVIQVTKVKRMKKTELKVEFFDCTFREKVDKNGLFYDGARMKEISFDNLDTDKNVRGICEDIFHLLAVEAAEIVKRHTYTEKGHICINPTAMEFKIEDILENDDGKE